MNSLIGFIIGVTLIGLGMWAINTYVPMAPTVKKLLDIGIIIILIVAFLYEIGLFPVRDISIPELRHR